MCGVDSSVYQTSDAGETWDYFGSIGKPINDIDITYDPNVLGYICGDDGAVGSITHIEVIDLNSGISADLSSVSSPLKDRVWLLGDSIIYYYNGSSFKSIFISSYSLNSILFQNDLYGWVVGDSGYIAHTSDGGNTWVQKQNSDTLKRNLNDISIWEQYGLIVGDDGLTLITTEAGESWIIADDGLTSNKLISVQGVYPALAVGENKTALQNPIVISVEDEPPLIIGFQLRQNYPNPFNPTTFIKYSIPSVTFRPQQGGEGNAQSDIFVTIKVYDVLGNEVAIIVNENKPAGEYEVEFDGTRLSSGIYFYQLRAGANTDTKKMILLR